MCKEEGFHVHAVHQGIFMKLIKFGLMAQPFEPIYTLHGK